MTLVAGAGAACCLLLVYWRDARKAARRTGTERHTHARSEG